MSKKRENPPNYFLQVMATLNAIKDARALILTAHGFLELLVNALIDHHCENAVRIVQERNFSYAVKLILLHEMSVIDNESFERLDRFRRIRNKAAHDTFLRLSKDELTAISPKFESKDEFPLLMQNILVVFWNKHVDVFAPLFMSTLFENDQRADN